MENDLHVTLLRADGKTVFDHTIVPGPYLAKHSKMAPEVIRALDRVFLPVKGKPGHYREAQVYDMQLPYFRNLVGV